MIVFQFLIPPSPFPYFRDCALRAPIEVFKQVVDMAISESRGRVAVGAETDDSRQMFIDAGLHVEPHTCVAVSGVRA
jgi:hypothetical protein